MYYYFLAVENCCATAAIVCDDKLWELKSHGTCPLHQESSQSMAMDRAVLVTGIQTSLTRNNDKSTPI